MAKLPTSRIFKKFFSASEGARLDPVTGGSVDIARQVGTGGEKVTTGADKPTIGQIVKGRPEGPTKRKAKAAQNMSDSQRKAARKKALDNLTGNEFVSMDSKTGEIIWAEEIKKGKYNFRLSELGLTDKQMRKLEDNAIARWRVSDKGVTSRKVAERKRNEEAAAIENRLIEKRYRKKGREHKPRDEERKSGGLITGKARTGHTDMRKAGLFK